jgi:hypothetical protein
MRQTQVPFVNVHGRVLPGERTRYSGSRAIRSLSALHHGEVAQTV